MFRARAEKLKRILQYLVKHAAAARLEASRLQGMVKKLGLQDERTWEHDYLPSPSYIRTLVRMELEGQKQYMEAALAAVDAGLKGVCSMDFTHAITK